MKNLILLCAWITLKFNANGEVRHSSHTSFRKFQWAGNPTQVRMPTPRHFLPEFFLARKAHRRAYKCRAMANGKERAAIILRGPDGKEMYGQLVRYAETHARIRGWRADATLPGSESPRSVAHGVVGKLLDPTGGRTWDEEKEPNLLNALKSMVRSEIGHLYEKIEENLVEPISHLLPDGQERTAGSFPVTDLRPEELNPEQQLLGKEREKLGHAVRTRRFGVYCAVSLASTLP